MSDHDLCAIKNVFPVEYVYEHENFNVVTRINDIAIVKVKWQEVYLASEVIFLFHKRGNNFLQLKGELNVPVSALPPEDNALGRTFYTVGHGEIVVSLFAIYGYTSETQLGIRQCVGIVSPVPQRKDLP